MLNKDRINLRRNASRSYLIGLGLVVMGMLFFLTSGFYIDEEIEVMASPIGEEIRITSATNLEIIEWIVDEEKQEMEVIIDLNEYEEELSNMEFTARQRSDLDEVNVELVLEYEQYIVLHINEFDANYTQISLRLDVESEDSTDTETNELEDDQEQDSRRLVTLYTDHREIEKGSVNVDSEENSMRYITNLLIEQSEETIALLGNEIEEKQEEITEIEAVIQELEQDKQYQTSEEKVRTDSRINSLEVDKNELETEQERANERIEIEEERIQNLIQRERDSSLSHS
ncbi:hypothetical protein [Alkalicoccus luteus]|uniref:Uncharacterized protein n=1 Tax=Alkalicoccus luteus TaxID=1237094 RepID=A0A969PV82_9BACI|nr:hypothetical protein [Alkalicoccus luteus]NJP38986.1 hypothetical protein [Alkalicoccus luteus]